MIAADLSINNGIYVHRSSDGGDHWTTSSVHLDTYDRMDTWFGVVDSAAHWASKAVHERLVDPGRSIQLGMRGHMSPWTQANVSDELGYLVLEKARCDDLGVEGVVTAILERVGDCPVYVSFDLDCLDPGIAPGVSNLEPGEDGFTMTQAAGILQGLRGRDVVGGDVVCLMPTKDNPNAITAMNATAIITFALNTSKQILAPARRAAEP